jgi:hypothetical protein
MFSRYALVERAFGGDRPLGNELILWQDMRGMCFVEMPAEVAIPG